MAARSTKATGEAPDSRQLKRETAGRHVTGDGRFTVEKGSGGWMVIDAEQTNELGLPLVRGPYDTLVDARAAVNAARSAPAPRSSLAARAARLGSAEQRQKPASGRPAGRRTARPGPPPAPPEPPRVVVREYRTGDGDGLRKLWAEAGLGSVGDDDASLRRLAARNPGLLLVAAQESRIVASALGAWDGRRGWIYHVATAAGHRRTGLATRLVRQVEAQLRALGARRVNVIVIDERPDAERFWRALGYAARPTRQYGRDLETE